MTKKNQKYYILAFVALFLFIGSFFFADSYKNKSGNYDEFATCIANSGAKFYGAYWCPHCQAQKAAFGKSKDKLPYVECSTANGQDQTEECKNKKIENYPTWEFISNGTTTRASGEQSFEALAKATNCPLPANYTPEEKKENNITTTTTQLQNVKIEGDGQIKVEAIEATTTN